MRLDEEVDVSVLSMRTLVAALMLHLALFAVFWAGAKIRFKPKELVVPIDLTVVVNENLDGKENEPPPVQEPPKEAPRPPPVKEPPKADLVPDDVPAVVEEKPKPPTKTRKELEEERMKRIRDKLSKTAPKAEEKPKPDDRLDRIRKNLKPTKAKVNITVDAPSGDGRTDKKTLTDAEIKKLLGEGYKPGASTQLAASEEQRCLSLIYSAFYAKWERPAWNDTLREMHLKVSFGTGGRVTGYSLVKSSTDAAADMSVRRAASLVQVVEGLSPEFIAKHRNDIVIRFKVTPQ